MSRRTNDKNQQILKTLLRDPSNSHCADCKTSSHPRWASWNLGIFICIRCSGIHRSLGTHISRVKSVDLDTWTDEQVKNMVLWGNAKANEYWEHNLPQGYVPDGGKIENFIRTKYDLKKWANGPIPDPQSLSGQVPTSNVSSTTPTTPTTNITNRGSANPRRPVLATSFSSSQLLDLEFGSPISSTAAQNVTQSQPPSRTTTPLVGNQYHHQQQFSTQQQRVPQQQQQQQQQQHQQQQQQQQQQANAQNARPDLKKSILSLYSAPMATNSAPSFVNGSDYSHASTHSSGNGSSVQSLSQNNSLAGLNFNSRPQQQPQQPQQQYGVQNEWSNYTAPTQTNQQSLNNVRGLDDDLFKNVWN